MKHDIAVKNLKEEAKPQNLGIFSGVKQEMAGSKKIDKLTKVVRPTDTRKQNYQPISLPYKKNND